MIYWVKFSVSFVLGSSELMNRYLVLDALALRTSPEGKQLYEQMKNVLSVKKQDIVEYIDVKKIKKRKFYYIVRLVDRYIDRFFRQGRHFYYHFDQNTKKMKKMILLYKPTHIVWFANSCHYISSKVFLDLKKEWDIKSILVDVEVNNLLYNLQKLEFYRSQELIRHERVLSISKSMVSYFNRLGEKNIQVMPAFAEEVKYPASLPKKSIDILFYGIPSVRRILLLERLSEQNLIVVGEKWGENKQKVIKNLLSEALKKCIITRNLLGDVLSDTIYKSKIILNISRDSWFSIESGVTVRHHQILAHGGFLLTEYCEELDDVYTMGKDLETYKTIEELEDKIQFYLKHDDAREKIAKQGHETFLKRHTTDIRAKEILTILGNI